MKNNSGTKPGTNPSRRSKPGAAPRSPASRLPATSPAEKKRPASAGPTASAEASIAKLSPARLAAFEILTLVSANKGHSDELLHSSRIQALSPEDRNLTTTLVMGVLRWQIALDARIGTLLQRPEQRLAEPVAIALRLGAFQLLHLDRIPAHAALSESVELCRAAAQPHATGMVNAVLRKLSAAQRPGTRVFESVAAFAERLGHPLWLVERWATHYGRDAALKICEAGQMEMPEAGIFEKQTDLPVMDDGSRLVAEIAASSMPHAQRVWDCCTAPGGKTLILAHRLPKAAILATDVSPKRLAQTAARLQRYAYASRVTTSVADVTVPVALGQSFDLILCDVPCSGTGTLAANPEIRHKLKPGDLTRQQQRQKSILSGALQRLAPGGRLIYSTCSLEPEECQQVVDSLLTPDLRLVPVQDAITALTQQGILPSSTDLSSAVQNDALRTLPGVHPCDGFYAILLERT